MPLHQRDFILRLIEQAGAAVARLKARLGLGGATEAETVIREAEDAQTALLGPLAAAVRVLDPASAAMLVGESRQIRAWTELLRLQARAHELRGDSAQADRLTRRADALDREAARLEIAGDDVRGAGSAPGT